MESKPTEEHRWLQRLVGSWKITHRYEPEPGAGVTELHGTERVRALGDLWILAEGEGDTPEGEPMTYVMALGYDPQRGRFVGSFVASPMAGMFVYEGSLDDAKRVLTLDTTGPHFEDPTKTMRYQDRIEIVGDDERMLISQVQGGDGAWTEFMRAAYRRVE